jgi:hypothetical protein
MSEMIPVTGLWKRKIKSSGETMLSGTISRSLRVVILPNKDKQDGDKKPDYLLFFSKNETQNPPDSKKNENDGGL